MYKKCSILFTRSPAYIGRIDFQNVIKVMQYMVQSGSRLLDEYRHCQQILKDNPPTDVQQIMHKICEDKWKINVSIELGKLGTDIQKHVSDIVDLIDNFSKCTGITIPSIHT